LNKKSGGVLATMKSVVPIINKLFRVREINKKTSKKLRVVT